MQAEIFLAQFPTDTTDAVLINKTAATKLGWTPEQAVGKWIQNTVRDNAKRRIIGVVDDFNFHSLKENMDALVISPNEDRRVALIKLKPGNIQAGIATVKNEYNKVASAYPFEYSFLDEQFDDLYKKDIRPANYFICVCQACHICCLSWFVWSCFIYCNKTLQRNWCKKSIGFICTRYCCFVIKRFVEACIDCNLHRITCWLLGNE